MALRRLRKELQDSKTPSSPHRMPNNCYAGPISDDDLYVWRALLIGPADTPYEDGHFYINFKFPKDYPFKPPKMKFETKIYHPQVNDSGFFYLASNVERDNWSPALTISKVLLAIHDMMGDETHVCGCHCKNPEALKLYQSNKKEYDKTAREWTEKFAQ